MPPQCHAVSNASLDLVSSFHDFNDQNFSLRVDPLDRNLEYGDLAG